MAEIFPSKVEVVDLGQEDRQVGPGWLPLKYLEQAVHILAGKHFIRQEDRDHWLFSVKTGLAGSIVLPSIECALKMAEIYARVRFDDRKDTPVPPVLAPGG